MCIRDRFLEVDPSRVDVNIHPTKVEAKFQEDRAIVAILQAAVKRALGRFHVAPSLDFDAETAFDIAPPKPGQEVEEPRIQLNPDYNPFSGSDGVAGGGGRGRPWKGGNGAVQSGGALSPSRDRIEATRRFFESGGKTGAEVPTSAEARMVFSEVPGQQAEAIPSSGTGFDEQRPLFQLFGGWIVTATRSGLVLVDQHRAHTRILYERFAGMAQQLVTGHAQQLLFPEELEVGLADAVLLEDAMPALSQLGFNLEPLPDGRVRLLGLPSDAGEGHPQMLVDAVLMELRDAGEVDAEMRASRAMAGVARGAAVPTGRTLTRTEMLDIVDGLFACQEPDRDPWGRPTIATFDREAVASRFR